jgi:3'(2'), 5'-bisphosphate nucleotidase
MFMQENIRSTVTQAVLDAGREILKIYSGDFTVYTKDDNSLLTEADRKSHKVLVSALSRYYPVLSEESALVPYEERRYWKEYWLIDPLDGTREFVKRNGEFTVNVALIRNGFPVAGWVYAPVKDTLYIGFQGKGAFRVLDASRQNPDELMKDGIPLPRTDHYRILRVVVSRSHLNNKTSDFIEKLRQHHGQVESISIGSSLKLCLVAEGAADVYPRFGLTMEWDTAAADAICRSVGSLIVNMENGLPLVYNKKDLHNPSFLVLRTLQTIHPWQEN